MRLNYLLIMAVALLLSLATAYPSRVSAHVDPKFLEKAGVAKPPPGNGPSVAPTAPIINSPQPNYGNPISPRLDSRLTEKFQNALPPVKPPVIVIYPRQPNNSVNLPGNYGPDNSINFPNNDNKNNGVISFGVDPSNNSNFSNHPIGYNTWVNNGINSFNNYVSSYNTWVNSSVNSFNSFYRSYFDY